MVASSPRGAKFRGKFFFGPARDARRAYDVREEMRVMIDETLREMRALNDELRQEMRALHEETRAQMRTQHEDVVSRLALLDEHLRPARPRPRARKPKS
jgi:hypothetical protein